MRESFGFYSVLVRTGCTRMGLQLWQPVGRMNRSMQSSKESRPLHMRQSSTKGSSQRSRLLSPGSEGVLMPTTFLKKKKYICVCVYMYMCCSAICIDLHMHMHIHPTCEVRLYCMSCWYLGDVNMKTSPLDDILFGSHVKVVLPAVRWISMTSLSCQRISK